MTAETVTTDPPAIRALGTDDAGAAARLSALCNWNQTAADWRLMCGLGRAYGIDGVNGSLTATALSLPYDSGFGWISMVLVDPDWRRQGLASALMARCIDDLKRQDRTPILDATPAGRPVYEKLGFTTFARLTRLHRGAAKTAAPNRQGAGLRPLGDGDWPAVLALDTKAFGADRGAILRHLAGRWPVAAWVSESTAGLDGFILGRDGRAAHQLGPLVATREDSARALLSAAISVSEEPLYIDLFDDHPAIATWLGAQGFAAERPYYRMAAGTIPAPGDSTLTVVAAGPELG